MGRRHERGPSGRPFNENRGGQTKSKKKNIVHFDLSQSGEGRKLLTDSKPTPSAPVDVDSLVKVISETPKIGIKGKIHP